MPRRRTKIPWNIATLLIGVLFGVGTALAGRLAFLLIPVLGVTIVMFGLLSRRQFDIVFYFVVAAAFFLPMNNVRLSSSLTVGDGFVVGALVMVVVMRGSQRDLRISGMGWLLLGIALIVTGGLLGSFFAVSVGASVAGIFRFGAATVALPILFGLWRPDSRKLYSLAGSFVLGSCIDAVVGLFFIRTVGRAQGLSTQPNHLALACLMAVGLALGLALSSRSRQQLLMGVSIVVLVSGTVSSGSRSGLVAEVLVIATVAWLTRERKLILISILGAVLFGLALFGGVLRGKGSSAVGRLLGGGGAAGSDQARSQTLQAAIHTIVHNPLTGRGFQNALETHDIVLELAATAGVLGLIGLGVVGWIAMRPVWAWYRWGSARGLHRSDLLLIGAIAAVLGFFANGIFGNELYDRYIWIVVTMAVALSGEIRTERGRGGGKHSPRTVVVAGPARSTGAGVRRATSRTAPEPLS